MERWTATDFIEAVAVLEAEPNEFDPHNHYFAQLAFLIDYLQYTVANLFTKPADLKPYDKTPETFLSKFTTTKPEPPPAKTPFVAPTIIGGKVVNPGTPGVVQANQPQVYTGPPRRVTNLTPEQEVEARMAISKAAWKAFAGKAEMSSVNDQRRKMAEQSKIEAERLRKERNSGRRTPRRDPPG